MLPRRTVADTLSRMGKTSTKITITFTLIEVNLCSTVVPVAFDVSLCAEVPGTLPAIALICASTCGVWGCVREFKNRKAQLFPCILGNHERSANGCPAIGRFPPRSSER